MELAQHNNRIEMMKEEHLHAQTECIYNSPIFDIELEHSTGFIELRSRDRFKGICDGGLRNAGDKESTTSRFVQDSFVRAVAINERDSASFALYRRDDSVEFLAKIPNIQIVGNATDNKLFGKWNCLIAVQPSERRILKLVGHGGEIIPGKIIDHIVALRTRITEGLIVPVQLDLDATMACPSKCSFCFSQPYRSTRSRELRLADDLLFSTIADWIERGVRVIRFDGGGDPLAHPRLLEAIEFAARRGAITALLTAADLLRTQHLARLVAAGTYVRISLNAATDRVRLLLHSPAQRSFGAERLWRLMAQLSALRTKAYGVDSISRMPLGATYMVHPSNIAEIAMAAQRTKDVGFDHISFRVILGTRHAVQFTPNDNSIVHREFLEARKLATNSYQVFIPTRGLTDTGYAPSAYFSSCISCTQRVLIEVGSHAREAAQVPCGRYRGSGFARTIENARHVLETFHSSNVSTSHWPSHGVLMKVSNYPSMCADCIDRSANLMFNGILRVLEQDRNTRFFRAQELNR